MLKGGSAGCGWQVIKPLLPKSRSKEQPPELRSFSAAEQLLGEDARFLRTPARERCTAALTPDFSVHFVICASTRQARCAVKVGYNSESNLRLHLICVRLSPN